MEAVILSKEQYDTLSTSIEEIKAELEKQKIPKKSYGQSGVLTPYKDLQTHRSNLARLEGKKWFTIYPVKTKQNSVPGRSRRTEERFKPADPYMALQNCKGLSQAYRRIKKFGLPPFLHISRRITLVNSIFSNDLSN